MKNSSPMPMFLPEILYQPWYTIMNTVMITKRDSEMLHVVLVAVFYEFGEVDSESMRWDYGRGERVLLEARNVEKCRGDFCISTEESVLRSSEYQNQHSES